MAGYSDVPYRALCRAYGSAMHYTEFVPVEAFLGRRINGRYRRRLDKNRVKRPWFSRYLAMTPDSFWPGRSA
ncbi:MAG: tRNA-dihydrouridine synthase [Chloroflexi bacterium]|nr:tRNA-dihydrouridine synthase [Chloroflexota bacterium]